ncbi:unnamed protein product [Rotaria socialis]|uniref:Uncharacterized protein n=1 Tax=Rotaria socialis TaxID=392032 RepID=A0A818REN5_9BILA|nr:unnamed protein product [Rotaria socialis]CAF4624705.1 unnamed protein product [Rotaria socialis]
MPKKINNLHGIYKRTNLSKLLKSGRNFRYRDSHRSSRINSLLNTSQQSPSTQNQSDPLISSQYLFMNIDEEEQDNTGEVAEQSSTKKIKLIHELQQVDENKLNESLIDADQIVNVEDGHDDNNEDDNDYVDDDVDGFEDDSDKNKDDNNDYVDNDVDRFEDNFDDDFDDELDRNVLKDEDSLVDQISVNAEYFEKTFSTRDIAVILCLIKRRHKCSNELIIDVISLLNKTVSNNSLIPKSIYDIRRLLNINSDQTKGSKNQVKTVTICQICETVQMSNKKCLNESCNVRENYLRLPYIYTWFSIRQQLEEILQREKNMISAPSSDTIMRSAILKNIIDGRLYKHVIPDGVQLASNSAKSLWLVTMTINEIDTKHRFFLNNLIICGVNSCYKKPTRKIMNLMIEPIVQQLEILEQGGVCEIAGKISMYKAFLLGSINDKPANSLLQNIPEPNAAFGCSKCELQGITVRSNTVLVAKTKQAKHITNNKKLTNCIRVFPTSFKCTSVRLRSSENYKKTLHELDTQRLKNPNLSNEQLYTLKKGYLGPCSLTRLRYFDHGQSFLSDTLHTVYGGAMKRLLRIFFENKFRTEEKSWTIQSNMEKINQRLQQYITPSSTVRLPRNINLYHRYKASEFRSILLVYYMIFKDILPERYYTHLKQLVFAMHIGENRQIPQDKLDEMHVLLQYHVNQFKILYGTRHMVNNIHSLIHLAETVRDYGPLQGYSTFNYESILGGITSTVNGTKNQEKEIYNNLQMLKESSYLATISQNSILYELMIKFLGIKYYVEKQKDNFLILKKRINETTNEITACHVDESENVPITLFNRCIYKNVQYDSYNINKKKDCAILYNDIENNKLQYALIDKFIQYKNADNSILFQVNDVINWHYDFLFIGTMKFECENVSIGELSKCTKLIHPSTVVEKVFSLVNANEVTVIRLPNLTESS